MNPESKVHFLSALNSDIKYADRVKHWQNIQLVSGRSEIDFWNQLNECRKELERELESETSIIDANGKSLFFDTLPILQIANGYYLGVLTMTDLTDLSRSLYEYALTITVIPTGYDETEIRARECLFFLYRSNYNKVKCRALMKPIFAAKTFTNNYAEVEAYFNNPDTLKKGTYDDFELIHAKLENTEFRKSLIKKLNLPYKG